jgi:hypothetical protein
MHLRLGSSFETRGFASPLRHEAAGAWSSRPKFAQRQPTRPCAAPCEGRRKGSVGQGPQTVVGLASASLKSRITWHRALGGVALAGLLVGASNGAAKIAPNAAKGPLSWPLPGLWLGVCGGLAVTGAGPSGSMMVCCATAGVADAKAQIAAVDRNMTDKRFMFLAPVEPDESLPLQTPA